MRDTLFVLAIVGISTWLALSRLGTMFPKAGEAQTAQATASSQMRAKIYSDKHLGKEAFDEQPSYDFQQAGPKQHATTSQGRSATIEEPSQPDGRKGSQGESLLSIYSKQVDSSDKRRDSTDDELTPTSTPIPTTKKTPQKVVYGVPLKSWVLSRENAIASAPAPLTDQGLQVFLQCMNVKKQMEYTGEQKCRELVIANRPQQEEQAFRPQ